MREFGYCSKADLVRASGLSAPAITNVVADLLASDLVTPLSEGESSGGRPPDIISFKAERCCVPAVEITAISISFLLTDLDGKELIASNVPLAGINTTPDAISVYIGEETRRLLRLSKKKRRQLLVLVVGVPAITNVDDGIVTSISTLEKWRSVPLRAKLMKIVKCLIIIENDTNLAALGERYRGAAQEQETFILIRIGPNVSAGIVLDGNIHHGSQWSAGKIRYLRLPHTSRKKPTLHEFGELERLLSSSGVLESWRKAGKHADCKGETRSKKLSALDMLDLSETGDLAAAAIVHDRAGIVADIITNLSLILNPSLILLGGELGAHPALISSVRRQLQDSEFAVPQIAAAALGENSVLWGAVSVAFDVMPTVLLAEPPV